MLSVIEIFRSLSNTYQMLIHIYMFTNDRMILCLTISQKRRKQVLILYIQVGGINLPTGEEFLYLESIVMHHQRVGSNINGRNNFRMLNNLSRSPV